MKFLRIRKILVTLVMVTAAFGQGITSFNAGEVTPLLSGRTDLQKYYSGLRDCENVVVLPHGPLKRRPGSYYIASGKTAANAIRLIPFEYSTDQAYIIEMGDLYMRFYRDGGQIDTSSEIVTPYAIADVFDVQFIQSADEMYLAHSDYATRVLTRTSHTSWTLTAVDFDWGPFEPENTTTTTMTPSATTGSITLTASASTFNANHVGADWQISHVAAATSASGTLTGVANSATVTVQKGRRFNWITSGTWVGTAILQRSYDSGVTYNDVKLHVMASGVPNISYADTEGIDTALYRVRMNAYTSGTCTYDLTALSQKVAGVAEITAYTNVTTVTATVTETLGGTSAVTTWNEGSFSADNGYPQALAFFHERLALAGTDQEPQTIWLSVTDDWDNFLTGDLATDSLSFTLASDVINEIQWLNPQKALLIGTLGAEWTLSATGADQALTTVRLLGRTV